MTLSPLDPAELYQFESLHEQAIQLTDEQIHQAQQASQAVPTAEAWQTYCDRLADYGLMNWLAENNLQAQGSDEIKVKDFVVRSQFVSAAEDEVVTIATHQPQAHYYILTTVAEEQGQVWVSGFLSHAQMTEQMAKFSNAGTIELPLDAFNPNLDSLLLALRLTEPQPLTPATPRQTVKSQVLNLRDWLTRKVDETLENLDGWEPLSGLSNSGLSNPNLAASGLRSTTENQTANQSDLPQILQSLARKGIRLADGTKGLSRIINIDPIPLRLYIVPGEGTEQNEWELLVVLESASNEPMPSGLMLRIRDDEQVLLEETFDPQVTTDRSIFAEVVSDLDESVWVDIVLPNGIVHSLPKFVFQQD